MQSAQQLCKYADRKSIHRHEVKYIQLYFAISNATVCVDQHKLRKLLGKNNKALLF